MNIDYQDFLASHTAVPDQVNEKLLKKMQSLISPDAWTVFIKILGIHLVIGFLSLSICHQFGLNPFHTERSLADWFMKVGGHHFCMFACGTLFVSVSLLTAGYFLSVEEVRALKRTELIQNLSLGLISLGLFTAFGVEFIVSIAGLWLLGSLLGGYLSTLAMAKLKEVK